MYNPKDLIEILAGNVRKTRSPFATPRFLTNRWHKGLSIPRDGEALLFTGLMYQFVPFIESVTHYLEKYEDTKAARLMRYGIYQPKRLSGLGIAMITPRKERRKADEILQNISRILVKSGVDFCYKPELDFYTGILLYDLGDQDGFVNHARFVAESLKKAGIRKLITVDPHTTYALKVLFPKYTGIHFDVQVYFELVDFEGGNGEQRVTLHDPCFYGRYLELSDAPRKALAKLHVECVDVPACGAFTSCCGGPAESVSPSLSRGVMERRVEELKKTGEPIVAMCPICLGQLRKSGAEVRDLSEVMARCAGLH